MFEMSFAATTTANSSAAISTGDRVNTTGRYANHIDCCQPTGNFPIQKCHLFLFLFSLHRKDRNLNKTKPISF